MLKLQFIGLTDAFISLPQRGRWHPLQRVTDEESGF